MQITFSNIFVVLNGRRTSSQFVLIALVVGLLCLGGCSRSARTVSAASTSGMNAQQASASPQTADSQGLLTIGVVYVAPVEAATGVELSSSKSQLLTDNLIRGLKEQLELELVTPQVSEQQLNLVAETHDEIFKAAASADADTVLFARVDRFIDRNGTTIGSSQGAEVALTISLRRIADRREIWTRSFGYRDQALSDNLLKLPSRRAQQQEAASAGWLSAEQLFNNGVRELARTLRRERVTAFQ